MFSSFLAFLDGDFVNFALPFREIDFHGGDVKREVGPENCFDFFELFRVARYESKNFARRHFNFN